jgi:opacity protein-like surface antigen
MESQLAEWIKLAVGVANTDATLDINSRGEDFTKPNGARSESHKSYMGAVTLVAPERWGFLADSALYAGIVSGPGYFGSTEDRMDVYVGASIATGLKGLKVGVAYDEVHHPGEQLLRQDIGSFTVLNGYANSLAGYVSYDATKRLSFHARAEYAKASVFSVANFGADSFDGTAKVFALTGTVQYDLWENVISRLEIRWDHSANGQPLFGGRAPGDIPSKKNDVMIAANIIYKF